MDNIVKDLHLQEYPALAETTEGSARNEKKDFIGPYLKQFKDCLIQYGLEEKQDKLVEAIRYAYLTAGDHPLEQLSNEAGILRQIEIGWPTLTNYGKMLGQELLNSAIQKGQDNLALIAKRYTPEIIQLLLESSEKRNEINLLKVPITGSPSEDVERFDSISQLVHHKKITSILIEIGHDLERSKLASIYSAPAYRGAKWEAYFIYFSVNAAEILLNKQATVTSFDAMAIEMRKIIMLRKTPVPSASEFIASGIVKEELFVKVKSAIESGAISKLSDNGPAFIILDESLYRKMILVPMIDNIINTILRKPEI
jgi:hypothetical protein